MISCKSPAVFLVFINKTEGTVNSLQLRLINYIKRFKTHQMFDFIEWHCETVLKHEPFCLLSVLKLEIKIFISMRISIIIGNIPHSLIHLSSYMWPELKLITQILWEIGWDWYKNIKGMELCGNIIQDLTTMFGNSKQFRLNTVYNMQLMIWYMDTNLPGCSIPCANPRLAIESRIS